MKNFTKEMSFKQKIYWINCEEIPVYNAYKIKDCQKLTIDQKRKKD